MLFKNAILKKIIFIATKQNSDWENNKAKTLTGNFRSRMTTAKFSLYRTLSYGEDFNSLFYLLITNNWKFSDKILIFFIFLLKTLIVGTR